MRWFARKPKPQTPSLKPPAEPVRMRRVRTGDVSRHEALARDRAAHEAERSSSPPPQEPAKPS